ncbi:hypothetical protein V8C44DRAFT_175193 [Trichoderma aethiopicum]
MPRRPVNACQWNQVHNVARMRRQRRCAAVGDAVICERRRLEAQERGLGAVKMHEALTLSY